MNTPITIVVHIKARSECKDAVRKRLLELVSMTTNEAGNVFYHLHEASADACHFIIYERWKNQAALDFHMQQDYLVSFLNDSNRILSEEIQGTICHEISAEKPREPNL
jgi:quinol monooxygenase YgiN